MKNNFGFALFMSLMFWSSCSNDFDVTATWKDIPVVYGLLNIDEDIHYIRIEKAFLDPETSALEIAQIADSLYYENATVQLERVSNGQLFNMQRVDGNDAGINQPRDPGIFATSPNWIYKIAANQINLVEGERIKLILDRGNGLPLVTAQTLVQGSMLKRRPLGANFDFFPGNETLLGWSASKEAKIFDVKLIFNYAEFPKDDPSAVVQKSFDWVWGKGITFGIFENEYIIGKLGEEFYAVVEGNITNDPNFNRIFDDIDIEIIAGGEELEKYINVALANSGITGSQELPSFTNISEGQGVFSTRSTLINKGFSITPSTRDSLKNGSVTKHLNFQ